MTERSDGWWSCKVERFIDARKVACRKLRGASKRVEGEGILRQIWDNYRRVRKGAKMKIKKELRKIKVRKIREHDRKLFWTDVRGKRKQQRLNRMKDEEGSIMAGEEEVLAGMARHWEELERSSDDLVRMM